jgi:hypothetical protein
MTTEKKHSVEIAKTERGYSVRVDGVEIPGLSRVYLSILAAGPDGCGEPEVNLTLGVDRPEAQLALSEVGINVQYDLMVNLMDAVRDWAQNTADDRLTTRLYKAIEEARRALGGRDS